MNIKLIKTVLVISLFINGLLISIAGYNYFFDKFDYETINAEKQGEQIQPGLFKKRKMFYNQLRQHRQHIQTEQTKLIELLMEEVPDTDKIETILENINRLRTETQKLTINQIITDLKNRSKEEKKEYLSKLRHRMDNRYREHRGRRLDSRPKR